MYRSVFVSFHAIIVRNSLVFGWFVQLEIDSNATSNESLIEKFRYRSESANVNRTRLVAELSLYKDPEMLSRLGFPVQTFTQRESLSQFVFVTAADQSHFLESLDAIASIQAFFPTTSIYFYDLNYNGFGSKVDQVSKCQTS